ncbi:MAG: tetratricopeptide repeat protein, partial [Alphaproteobacteria bacterium]
MLRHLSVLGAALVVLLIAWTSARADFETGMAAYERGDYAAAMGAWRPLADAGDAEAQYRVGTLYQYGYGVQRDYAEAVSWYETASAGGHREAQFSLGWLYLHGGDAPGGSVTPDVAKAAFWLASAAEAGMGMAEYLIGRMHLEGSAGLAIDESYACTMLVRAAEHGVPMAQYEAGYLLGTGRGCERDEVAAYAWFAIAA